MSKYTVRFFTGDYIARQQAANEAKAIVYVEQHFNSSSDPKSRGVEVVVADNASTKSRQLGTAYAKRIAFDLGVPLRHAPGGLLVGGCEGRGNGNLKYTAMPAVLLETCFASNGLEAQYIRDPFKHKVMAKALADVIRDHFPDGGLVAFSVGHKYKTSSPSDRGAPVEGGGFEADYAEAVLTLAAHLLAEDKVDAPPLPPPPAPTLRATMGGLIVNFEARRDKHGHLVVYRLPAGDGGGQFEVAGINDKYHPVMVITLRGLIDRGEYAEAEAKAAEYIMQYTEVVHDWMTFDGHDMGDRYPQIEFYLRDSAFNRGPGGAAVIMQKALSVPQDGKVGPFTRSALLSQLEESPEDLLHRLRAAREWYERNRVQRDETSPFWKGLVNRWNGAMDAAMSLT